MSETTAAPVDSPNLYCFTCGVRQNYVRLLASVPVYKCPGCGGTREIWELGRPASEDKPPKKPRVKNSWPGYGKWKKSGGFKGWFEDELLPRFEEKTEMKNSPLQDAIAAEVKRVVKDVATKEDLDKLTEKVDAAASVKYIEQVARTWIEDNLQGFLERALLQMLSRPKDEEGGGSKPRRSSKTKSTCPRAPHMGRHGKACVAAGYQA